MSFLDHMTRDELYQQVLRERGLERERILGLMEEIRHDAAWSGHTADALFEVLAGEIKSGRKPLTYDEAMVREHGMPWDQP